MSQSNDSPAPCADKEGHDKSTTSVCDTLFPEARGQKKRNLATVTSSASQVRNVVLRCAICGESHEHEPEQ